MLFNKNEVRKASEKKVLHKSGKNWIVLSSALLLALAGGAAVSSQSTSANADGISPQTSAEVQSLMANNYAPASSATSSKAASASAKAPSLNSVNYNSDNGGSAASEHAQVNYDKDTMNFYGKTVHSYVNSLNARFPKQTKSLNSAYNSANAKSSTDASNYNYYSNIAAQSDYSEKVSSIASASNTTASEYVDSVYNQYYDDSNAAQSASSDVSAISNVVSYANEIRDINNNSNGARVYASLSLDSAAFALTYADKNAYSLSSIASNIANESANAVTNYNKGKYDSLANSMANSAAIQASGTDASFVNSIDAHNASNTASVNAGNVFSSAISYIASTANAGSLKAGDTGIPAASAAANSTLVSVLGVAAGTPSNDSAATVLSAGAVGTDDIEIWTDNTGNVVAASHTAANMGVANAGQTIGGATATPAYTFNISNADVGSLVNAIQDTANLSAAGSAASSATATMDAAKSALSDGPALVSSANQAYNNGISAENSALSAFIAADIMYKVAGTPNYNVNKEFQTLYNSESVTASDTNDAAMTGLRAQMDADYNNGHSLASGGSDAAILANGAQFGDGTNTATSAKYALLETGVTNTVSSAYLLGNSNIASSASNAIGDTTALGTNNNNPSSASSAASAIAKDATKVYSNVNSATSKFNSYSNNADIQIALASDFVNSYSAVSASDSAAVSSASDALSNFYMASANASEAKALNAYNSANDNLPNDEALAHAYGVNVQNHKPKYITTTKDAVLHSNPAFALKADKHLARIPSNTELNVINVGFDVVGNVRYYVKYGKRYGYITANPYFSKSTYLEPLDNIDVVLDHNIKGYNDVLFKNPNGKTYKAGTELDGVNAVREDHYYEGFTRIQLNDGSYITSNTNWVHVVNGNNDNSNQTTAQTNNANPNDNSTRSNASNYNMFWN